MPRYLSDGGNAPGQATGEAHEDVFDRRRAIVLGCEDFGVIRVELELGLVRSAPRRGQRSP